MISLPGGHDEEDNSNHDLFFFLLHPLTCVLAVAVPLGVVYHSTGMDSLFSGKDFILAIWILVYLHF